MDLKQLYQKGKLIIYIRVSFMIYHWQNRRLVNKICKIIELK